MAGIGKVSAVFTASTSGLTKGVEAAGKAFRALGGDTTALRSALNTLSNVSKQGFLEVGPAANAASDAFTQVATEAGRLRAELASGAISAGEFSLSMANLTREAQGMAAAVAAAAAITRENVTAEQTYFAALDRVALAVEKGGLGEEVAARARERAYQTYLKATEGATQEINALEQLADTLNAVGETGQFDGLAESFASGAREALGLSDASGRLSEAQRSAAVAEELAAAATERRRDLLSQAAQLEENALSAVDRHALALQDLAALQEQGRISAEAYNVAVAEQDRILADADGTAAATARALKELEDAHIRGAAVTRDNYTSQEKYAATVDDLRSLLNVGAINQQTYNRAVAEAKKEMDKAADAAKKKSKELDGVNKRLNALIALDVGRYFLDFARFVSNSISSLVRFGAAQADVVDRTGKLAERLGMTYGDFAGLAYAGTLADVSMESVAKAATKADVAFVKASQGSKQATAAFANLGLNVEQLAGMNAADRFDAIAQSIAALPTEAQRAAAAVQIFGRSGAELLPLFNQGADAIAAARAEAEAFGLTLTGAQRNDVEAMNDSFKRAQQAIAGVVQQVVAFLSPAISGIVDQFNAFIANVGGANIGQSIGEGILQGAEYLAGIGDWIIANFSSTFQYLSDVGQQLGGVFGFLNRTVSFLSGVFNIGKAVFLTFVNLLSQTFEKLATIAQRIGQFLGFDTSTLDVIVEGAKAFNAEIANGINQAGADASRDFGNAFATDAAPVGQAVAGPLVTALRDARQTAQDSAKTIDEARKAPVDIKQTVEVQGIAQALKAVDSRSTAGVAEMFRIMRGDTGNAAERTADAAERTADATEELIEVAGISGMDF